MGKECEDKEELSAKAVDFLNNASFELMPKARVLKQANCLNSGTIVPLTCSEALGGIDATIRCAKRLSANGLDPIPHIPARLVKNEGALHEIISNMQEARLRKVFVPGGDIKTPVGPFESSYQLLKKMYELGNEFQEIGIAAHPQGHPNPKITNKLLMDSLLQKQQYATYIVTQICDEPKQLKRWLYVAKRAGVTLPIYIGIMGPVNLCYLAKLAKKFGLRQSTWFLKKNPRIFFHSFGAYDAAHLFLSLLPEMTENNANIHGIHINTFNFVSESKQWRDDIKESQI